MKSLRNFRKWWVVPLFSLLLSLPLFAETVVYQGREFEVELVTLDGLEYLEASSLLRGLGWYQTSLGENRVGLCFEQICVPVEVGVPGEALRRKDELFLAVNLLEKILSATIEHDSVSGRLRFQSTTSTAAQGKEEFPELTLPLVNGEGELNTLDYLVGRRAIVFCFASW